MLGTVLGTGNTEESRATEVHAEITISYKKVLSEFNIISLQAGA